MRSRPCHEWANVSTTTRSVCVATIRKYAYMSSTEARLNL